MEETEIFRKYLKKLNNFFLEKYYKTKMFYKIRNLTKKSIKILGKKSMETEMFNEISIKTKFFKLFLKKSFFFKFSYKNRNLKKAQLKLILYV